MSNESLKDQKEEEVQKPYGVIIALITFVPLILRGVTQTYYLPIISILAIIIFVLVAYKTLTNVINFAILLFLLSVVFPLIHFGIYRLNKDNYKFEGDFLAKKTKSIVEQSANHIEIKDLSKILGLKDSILNFDIEKLDQKNIYILGDFIIHIEAVRTEHLLKYIVLYNSKGYNLGQILVTENTIEKCFLNEQNFLQQTEVDAKNPSDHIFANDFWIESITAFTFGNVKANSNLVIAIKAIQYIAVFVFFAMLTNTLRTMDSFVMKRRT